MVGGGVEDGGVVDGGVVDGSVDGGGSWSLLSEIPGVWSVIAYNR